MKRYFKLFTVSVLSASMLIFSGCEKDWLDINDDPNSPLVVPLNQLLPTVQVRMALALGQASLSSTTGYYMQHNVTRGAINDWNITPGTAEGAWNTLYSNCLTDIREIINIGTATEQWHYVGVAKIMKGYIFTVLVDLWGNVPFTEANLGSLNSSPKFDNGANIYDGAIALINEGLADLEKDPGLLIRTDDLIYAGNIEKWKKFANTQKLRLYNQMRNVRNVSADVNALLNNPAELIDIDPETGVPNEDFELAYGTNTNPDDRNPAYLGSYSPGSKPYPNPYFYEVMRGEDTFNHGGNIFPTVEDPRVRYYFYNQLIPGEAPQNPAAYHNTATGFLSIYSFSFNIHPNEGFDQSESQSVMGLYPVGGRYDDGLGATANNNGFGSTPQRMLTFFNRKYIEAELAWAGVTGADPAVELEAAIRASFVKVNQVAAAAGAPAITDAAINAYVTSVMAIYNNINTNNDEKLQIIMTQKWIANYGYALDSYNDYRRTGFPVLHDGNTDNTPFTSRTAEFVLSFPYPQNEVTLNVNAPAQRNPYLNRVFWNN